MGVVVVMLFAVVDSVLWLICQGSCSTKERGCDVEFRHTCLILLFLRWKF